MSTTRGIFETFQNPGAQPQQAASPFAIASENPPAPNQNAAPSPFGIAPATEAPRKESPFAIVSDDNAQDDSRNTRLPERRKPPESPFQVAEPLGFGFEAPQQAQPQALRASPFEVERALAPQQAPLQPSPFSIGQPAAAPQAQAQNSTPFGGWPQADVAPRPAAAAPQPQYQQYQQAAAPVPAAQDHGSSDSFSIKQLELRAIFGVDREMNHDEILQRARSLPGIRQIARVSDSDISAVDALKVVISNLGFGSSPIKLYSGSVPIEFIREGKTLLAVQTDGGFAPGVRETLMIVARELGR